MSSDTAPTPRQPGPAPEPDNEPAPSAHGEVTLDIATGIATLTFSHPKGNSLPASLLAALTAEIEALGTDYRARVIVLRSAGSGSFCAGASFDELKRIDSADAGTEFFMGFARLMLAMRRSPKLIVTRVHGKVVGGGVGIVAASDYAIAVPEASARLSEVAVGIGPFVVGPVIEHRIGRAAFGAMGIDAEWRDAEWALRHGLYARLSDNVLALDQVIGTFAHRLASFNPDALQALKAALNEGTGHWETLLPARAAMSGRLVTSEFTRQAIAAFERRV